MLVCHSDYHRHRRLLVVQNSSGQKCHLCIESRTEPRIVFPPDQRVQFLTLAKFSVDVELSSQADLVKAFDKRLSTLSVRYSLFLSVFSFNFIIVLFDSLQQIYDGDLLNGDPTHIVDLPEKFDLPKITDPKTTVLWQDLFYYPSGNRLHLLSQPPTNVSSKKVRVPYLTLITIILIPTIYSAWRIGQEYLWNHRLAIRGCRLWSPTCETMSVTVETKPLVASQGRREFYNIVKRRRCLAAIGAYNALGSRETKTVLYVTLPICCEYLWLYSFSLSPSSIVYVSYNFMGATDSVVSPQRTELNPDWVVEVTRVPPCCIWLFLIVHWRTA